MAYKHLHIGRHDGYSILTLDNPRSNLLSQPLIGELRSALDEFRDEEPVRCLVITGAGRAFFSAGAEVEAIQDMLSDPFREGSLFNDGLEMVNMVAAYPKPIIAAVNGVAIGGGCELSLACHFRMAAEKAKFALPEVKLGAVPGWGGTHRLPRLIGESRAMEWMMTGRTVSAKEAFNAGLVCRLTPRDKLLAAAGEMASRLASHSPVIMRALLEAYQKRGTCPGEGAAIEKEAAAKALSSQDTAEGLAAFLEKRPPRYTGK